ncbi:hypothetical protein JCM12298_19190 [Desulfothermus naphthae]
MKVVNKKIFSNTGFMSGSSLLGRIIAYVYFLILVRSFSKLQVGLYAVLITSYLLMELIGNLGLDKIIIRDLAKSDETIQKTIIFYSTLEIKLFTSIFIWILFFMFFKFLYPYHFENYSSEIILFFASIFPLCMAKTIESYFIAQEKMYIPAGSQFLERLSLLFVSVLVYVKFIGFAGFLIGFFLSVGIRTLLLIIIFVKEKKFLKPTISFDKIKVLAKESMRMLPIEALALIYFRVDIFMLSKMVGLSLTGIYQVCYKIFDFFVSLFGGFLIAIFPSLSREKREFDLLKKAYIGFFIMCIISLFTIYFRREILIFFKKDFVFGSTTLVVLMLTLPFVYLNSLLAHYAIAINKILLLFLMAIVLVISNIGLNILFIPKFSILGAAISTFICEVICTLLMFLLLFDFYKKFRNN